MEMPFFSRPVSYTHLGRDWNVAGRYHDALKLGYANKNNEVHLILAFNQNNDNRTSGGTYYDSSTGQPYKNMQTVWYHYKADNVPVSYTHLDVYKRQPYPKPVGYD